MTYPFPPDVQQLVQQQLATGQYASEDDLLRDALQGLAWRAAETAAIQEGIEDMQAGRYRDLEAVDADIRQKHGFPPNA